MKIWRSGARPGIDQTPKHPNTKTPKHQNTVSPSPKKEPVATLLASGHWVPLAAMAALCLVFLVIMVPALITTHAVYRLGDVAERAVRAPQDFFVEDAEATEAKRRQAMEAAPAVYDHDIGLAPQFTQSVTQSFALARAILETPDRGPVEAPASAGQGASEPPAGPGPGPRRSPHDELWQNKESFENRIGTAVSNGAFRLLEENRFDPQIAEKINQVLTAILENGVVANKEMLLREADKGITLRAVGTGTEQIVTNLKGYYGLDQARAMVRTLGQNLFKDIHYNIRNLIIDLCQQLVQPNITFNREETEVRRVAAADRVKPVLFMIKAGEIILREGERVSDAHLLRLEALNKEIQRGRVMVGSLGATLLLMAVMVVIYILFLLPRSDFTPNRNRHLLFIALVLVAAFLGTRFWQTLATALTHGGFLLFSADAVTFGLPLAAGAMILSLFLGLELALPLVLVMAVGAGVLLGSRLEWFVYFLLNSILGAYWMKGCRERIVFTKAGAKLGLANMALATVINLYSASFSAADLLWNWTFAFCGGMGSGVIAAGMIPLMEIVFGYTSDIKLLELANLDRPLLRRLMLEAPGTYHHSVVVGSLVEAAAAQINANPLLGKVCGYYHDIGKINKPLYFIENQTDGKNRHDKLAPTMSKRILIAHVKDGVEIARQHKLGQVISDTIQQSHGTSLIAYFYEKAKQQAGEDGVNQDDFRYPGPRPQTREAGLVMLADVVEAASRTLENPTPSRIQGLVQRLINKIFSDGQLDECELTLKDLHRIAKSFNVILNGIHHHRVEYPEKAAPGNGKSTNGSSDRQSPKGTTGEPKSGQADSSGHLRRLGLS